MEDDYNYTDVHKISLSLGNTTVPKETFIIQDNVYGNRYFVRDGDTYKEVTKDPVNPIRIHADRKYVMFDSASFIKAVGAYGDKTKGIIFYEKSQITMFFSEDSRKESITLPLSPSLEFISFLDGKEKSFNQKDFFKLLETFPECVKDAATLLPMVEKVQLSTNIEFESNIDRENITFIYQEKTGGNQTGRLPKKLILEMPYFERSENKIKIEADFEVSMPRQEGAKPEFNLINVKHQRTERDALDMEITSLAAKLEGWLFVNGKY